MCVGRTGPMAKGRGQGNSSSSSSGTGNTSRCATGLHRIQHPASSSQTTRAPVFLAGAPLDGVIAVERFRRAHLHPARQQFGREAAGRSRRHPPRRRHPETPRLGHRAGPTTDSVLLHPFEDICRRKSRDPVQGRVTRWQSCRPPLVLKDQRYSLAAKQSSMLDIRVYFPEVCRGVGCRPPTRWRSALFKDSAREARDACLQCRASASFSLGR
jgi:hypothetical protein